VRRASEWAKSKQQILKTKCYARLLFISTPSLSQVEHESEIDRATYEVSLQRVAW